MTKEQFENLKKSDLLQPIYKEFCNESYHMLSIDSREGLVEINEKRMFSDTMWYRYENLNIVRYSKVIDKNTFEKVEKFI